MKHVVVCLLCALGLAGCATSPSSTLGTEVDSQKVAAIERAASQSGVKVIWVNMPQKAVRAPGS